MTLEKTCNPLDTPRAILAALDLMLFILENAGEHLHVEGFWAAPTFG